MTQAEANRLRAAINSYAQAAVNESWKGAGDPAEADMLTFKMTNALLKLDRLIDRYTETSND
jgi:hypothetical protein